MEKGNQLITADASVIERLAIFSESEILKLANLITKPEVKIAVIDGVIRKYHPNTSVFAVFRFDAPELRNILFVHYIQKLLEEGDTKAFSDDWFFYCFKEFMKSTSVKSVNENTITTMKKLVELSARFIKSKEKSKEFNELLESFLSSDSKSENVSNDKSIVVTSQALVDSVKHSFRLTKSSSAVAVLRYLEQQRDARADISPNEWSAVSEIVSKWISDIV